MALGRIVAAGGSSEIAVDSRLREALDRGEYFWLDVHRPSEDDLRVLEDLFGFHPLAVEDSLHWGQRPKLDEYDDFVLLVVYGWTPDGDGLVEVHCYHSTRFLVTLRRDDAPALDDVRPRAERALAREYGAIVVLHQVVDALVDSFAPPLERLNDRLELIEDELLARPSDRQMQEILAMRRHLAHLRKAIAPQRDLIGRLLGGVVELPGMTPEAERYFRDVYDHLFHLAETIDAYRELITGTIDVYLSTASNRLGVVKAADVDRDDLPPAHLRHRLLRPQHRVDGRPGRLVGRVPRARRRPPALDARARVRLLPAAGLVLSDPLAAWEALEPPWRECLELAWLAYAAGTIPVGAVVVRPDGTVVARGRNRVYDREAPPGELAYSLLAHAEVNALAKLPPEPRYEDHALWSALEPCLLCVGATRLATVGRIRFAGADPYGGAARLSVARVNPMLERAGIELSGPELGRLGAVVTTLHAELFLRRNPGGFVVAAYRRGAPALVEAAEALRARGLAQRAASGRSLVDVLPDIWDVVPSET